MRRVVIALLLLSCVAVAADRVKALYKASRISPNVVGISCPENPGSLTVVGKYDNVLLVSCK